LCRLLRPIIAAAIGTGITAGSMVFSAIDDPKKMDQVRVLRRVSYALYLGESHDGGRPS